MDLIDEEDCRLSRRRSQQQLISIWRQEILYFSFICPWRFYFRTSMTKTRDNTEYIEEEGWTIMVPGWSYNWWMNTIKTRIINTIRATKYIKNQECLHFHTGFRRRWEWMKAFTGGIWSGSHDGKKLNLRIILEINSVNKDHSRRSISFLLLLLRPSNLDSLSSHRSC